MRKIINKFLLAVSMVWLCCNVYAAAPVQAQFYCPPYMICKGNICTGDPLSPRWGHTLSNAYQFARFAAANYSTVTRLASCNYDNGVSINATSLSTIPVISNQNWIYVGGIMNVFLCAPGGNPLGCPFTFRS